MATLEQVLETAGQLPPEQQEMLADILRQRQNERWRRETSAEARLVRAPDGNEVFAIFSKALDHRLRAAGAVYHPWSVESLAEAERPGADEVLVRLIASFSTHS